MRLILGTAEFGPQPYGEGVKAPPTKIEIVRILNLAWEAGIRTLDTSDQYGTEPIDSLFVGFDRLFKSRQEKSAYYHYKQLEEPIKGIKKASVYTPAQVQGLEEAIVPFNINNTTFLGQALPPRTCIRSVFDRGRLLKAGYSVKDCLSFVKRANAPGGVIVGVNSVKELTQILKAWN